MNYRREIDGLRALAVLPVILFHAGFETFSGGFVGVDVFFVISGYLITTIILAELEQGKFSIVGFYERRARRILPALFLVMLICIPFAWFWLLPSDMKNFSQSLIAVSVFASNILFWHESGYFDTAAELKPLLHTWSLAVEEQYYVLFPLFLMLFWKLGKRWILVTLGLLFVASLAMAQWAAYAMPAAAFFLLPARGWELLIGALAAFYLSQANRDDFGKGLSECGGWLGVALILFAVFAYSDTTPFPGFYALVPTLGTVLIILFASQQTTVGKFVGNKAFVSVGLVSYSAYLWHQPLLAFARVRLTQDEGVGLPIKELPTLTPYIVIVVTFFLAYVTWKYVETRFRRKSFSNKWFGKRNWAAWSTLGLLIFVFVGALGVVASRDKTNGIQLSTTWASDVRKFDCLLQREEQLTHSSICRSDKKDVVLWGDSHAASLSIGLRNIYNRQNIGFTQLTQSGCPPLLNLQKLVHRKNCNEVNSNVINYIVGEKFKKIILHAAWIHKDYPLSETEVLEKISSVIDLLQKKSPDSKITLVGSVPRWPFGPLKQFNLKKEDGLVYADSPFILDDFNLKLGQLASRKGVSFIDPATALCRNIILGKECIIAVESNNRNVQMATYTDWGHLSAAGSNLLVDFFKADLLRY